jgi:hypothetical protein
VNSAIAGASVVCNIALNILLIPRFGIDGAAWASTASYSLLFVATAGVYWRITHVPLRALAVPSRGDGARYLRLLKRLAHRQADGPAALPEPAWPRDEESVPVDTTSRRSS